MAQSLIGTIAMAANDWLHGKDISDRRYEQKAIYVGGTNGAGGNLGPGFLYDTQWMIRNMGVGNTYQARPENLQDNSAVMASLAWIMRNFPQAPMVIAKRKPDRTMGEIIENHPLDLLVRKPNKYASGRLLWQSTALSYNINGNAYWIKVRNGAGRGLPVELWWEPHFSIRPVASSVAGELIGKYQIFRAGYWFDIEVQDVVHFKFGQDPRNPMLGISVLETALREVFIDEQAAEYSATMLKNLGVVGWIISPPDQGTLTNVNDLRNLVTQRTTGANRGMPMVWSEALKVEKPDNRPGDMMAADIRQTPVERITGLTGVNRMVAGLGKDPTYANFEQAREAAYEENIMPTKDSMADTLDNQLLPEFENNPAIGVYFSYATVRVLQDDQDALSTRIRGEYLDGIIKRTEAQVALGYEPDTSNDGYHPDPRISAALITAGLAKMADEDMASAGLEPLEQAPPPPPPAPPTVIHMTSPTPAGTASTNGHTQEAIPAAGAAPGGSQNGSGA